MNEISEKSQDVFRSYFHGNDIVIVAPLNWGLGHASRCIPVIHWLIQHCAQVIIASDGESLELLKKEFPQLTFESCPGYNIRYKYENILVGGFIRDTLLGLEPHDRDYVVVGSSEAEMTSLGFTRVGDELLGFPVFLHPETKEEYALARKERKVGVGYGGFEVDISDVTLEEDLFRRDLTLNSRAISLILVVVSQILKIKCSGTPQ